MTGGQGHCVTMGQQLPLCGPQFSIREDQNLGTELSKCQCGQLHVEMGAPLAGLSLMLCPSPPHCLQLWSPRSEPGETSHRPRT